jgi:serine/threonine protein kinase
MPNFAAEFQRQREQQRLDGIKTALDALNKFDLGEQAQEGMNAYAFKAFHRQLSRDVFLKLYPFDDQQAVQSLREPTMLAGMTSITPKCPNIVDVFDAQIIGTSDGNYLLMQMEFVHGGSLLGRIRSAPVGQQEAVRLCTGILTGLCYLHSQRILHRDLKPANILLASNTPKIGDFGSVSLLPHGALTVSASRHSTLYIPPEGWLSPSQYGFSSDIYQVGIVLYELVNGPLNYNELHYLTPETVQRLGREGRNPLELSSIDRSTLVQAGICDFARKAKLLEHGQRSRPYLSKKLLTIIKKATHPETIKRFQTAPDFIGKVSQIDVPNWIPVADETFTAFAWREKDWRVRKESRSIVLEHCKPGGKFRQVSNTGGRFDNLNEAFQFVEEY